MLKFEKMPTDLAASISGQPTAARRVGRAALLCVVLGVGCVAPPRDANPLAAASERAARVRAEQLLQAAVGRDLAAVRGALCPALSTRGAELLEPGQALAIEAFAITRMEPVWVGAEPVFYVAVELTRQGVRLPRALRVRAREGCVDQLLDSTPVGEQTPDPGEVSL